MEELEAVNRKRDTVKSYEKMYLLDMDQPSWWIQIKAPALLNAKNPLSPSGLDCGSKEVKLTQPLDESCSFKGYQGNC